MNATQALVEHEAPEPSASAAIIQVIERAAMNPAVDIDKMERLLEMQERIMARNAKASYTAALAAMAPDLPIIEERGEIKHGENKPVQSTYAKWEDINAAIKPILAAHAFALSFRIGQAAEKITITGVLSHGDGHTEETTITLPVDMSGSKNGVQGVGSSLSYGQRYTAKLLLNLTSRASEDDDGQAAGAGGFVTQDQADEIRALAEEVKADLPKFLAYFKSPSIAELPAAKFKNAIAALEKKRGQ